jgi:hypothetical protein
VKPISGFATTPALCINCALVAARQRLGRKLLTLKDAADYIMKLPKKESDLPEWQTAIEALAQLI